MKNIAAMYIVMWTMYIVIKGYEHNSFIRMGKVIKEAVYPGLKEPCWVCTQMPPDSERGLAFVPWPIAIENDTLPMPARESEVRHHQEHGDIELKVEKTKGSWCLMRKPQPEIKVNWKNVGESTCTRYYNGTHIATDIEFKKAVPEVKNREASNQLNKECEI